MIDRRSFLTAAGSALALATPTLGLARSTAPASVTGLRWGSARPFSFEALVKQARQAASRPHAPPPALPRDVLERIDYDAHGQIRFKTDLAPFQNGTGAFPLTFFHLGRYFQTPVHMHLLEPTREGLQAREILYDPSYFDMPADSPAHQVPQGAGFAGFRFQEDQHGDQKALPWQKNDWVAFLGASYFRAIGELYQYGLSARAVALDAALPDRPEEFPSFTHFWFEPQQAGGRTVTVHALLDGPSVTGAYRFVMTRGPDVKMDVTSRLFLRKDVARLGLAPLTSMYWYSETRRPELMDWRPEVHDSDGLAIWLRNGERIWRPLANPASTQATAFEAPQIRGFGLLQRDRVFDHYQDGVNYERRPSLWVEPVGDWGDGAVQLVEIPTDDEIHDNILAMWVPKAPARAGQAHALDYRLHWSADEPQPSALARVVATRLGRGGQLGAPRPAGVRKYTVEFLGAPLAALPFGVKPEVVVTASQGQCGNLFAEAVPNGVAGHWRASFDLIRETEHPVDLRLFLKQGDQALSETWLYLDQR